VLANNLTRGLIPGPFMQDVPLEPDRDPWRRVVARAFFSFCRPYAHFPEYLLLGESRPPPRIRCAEREVRSTSMKPERSATVKLPVVTAGSFMLADGSIGTVIVNTTDQLRQAAVTVSGRWTLHRTDRTVELEGKQTGGDIDVTLEPFGVRMLVTR